MARAPDVLRSVMAGFLLSLGGCGGSEAPPGGNGDGGDGGSSSEESGGDTDTEMEPDLPPDYLGAPCLEPGDCPPGLSCVPFPIPDTIDNWSRFCVDVGETPEGGSCELTAEIVLAFKNPCEEGLICDLGRCSRTCQVPEDCASDEMCRPALYPPLAQLQACKLICDPDWSGCPNGWACLTKASGSSSGRSGVAAQQLGCADLEVVPIPGVNAACLSSQDWCANSICSESGVGLEDELCRATCRLDDDQCAAGTTCTAASDLNLEPNVGEASWDGLCL